MIMPGQPGYKMQNWEVTTGPKRMRQLINITTNVLRETVAKYERPIMLWAGGKDGGVMLHIAYETFKSTHGTIPFPIVHVDTKRKFREIINYQDLLAKEMNLDFHRISNRQALIKNVNPKDYAKTECCTELKTNAMIQFIKEYNADAVITAIRWDEHTIRSKQNYEEEMDDPHPHARIFPILDWTMNNIWDYYKMYGKPYNVLYDYVFCNFCGSTHTSFKDGKYICGDCTKTFEKPNIYQSLGCVDCTVHVLAGSPERAGRAQDKEHEEAFELLKKLGYMG